jgi:hypothetical protein
VKCAVKRLTGRSRRNKDNIKVDLRDVEVVRTGTDEGHVAWQTAVLAVFSLRVLLRFSATRTRHKVDPVIQSIS